MKETMILILGIILFGACCYSLSGDTVTIKRSTFVWLNFACFTVGGILTPFFLLTWITSSIESIIKKWKS